MTDTCFFLNRAVASCKSRSVFILPGVLPVSGKRKQMEEKKFQQDGMSSCCHDDATGSRQESPERREYERERKLMGRERERGPWGSGVALVIMA